ncbi:MAG TPA: ATP-binding protein [Spirochaetota bacterium]|nr:ATP-binding protein [Spirochaetota bacterium]
MLQKSAVEKRAEKEYKNKHNKFGLLFREVISNSIQSVILLSKKDNEVIPNITLNINTNEKLITIEVIDNGEGFTEHNLKCFSELDLENEEKVKSNFKPLGQGRLAIIWFTDSSNYKSIFKDNTGNYKEILFSYPLLEDSLFDFEKIEAIESKKETLETKLSMEISKPNTLYRANTFFKTHDSIEKLIDWFIDNFFPFFMEYEKLNLNINYNSNQETINKSYIQEKIENIIFDVNFKDNNNLNDKNERFSLWLIPIDNSNKKITISCFARGLLASINDKALVYEIELPDFYKGYLASDFFNEKTNSTGDEIYIEEIERNAIEMQLIIKLDEKFKNVIEENREKSLSNLVKIKKDIPSLAEFINNEAINETNIIITQDKLLETAIHYKGKAETDFWRNDKESKDYNKIINSSLYIYVEHRQRVLKEFFKLIKLYDDEGQIKKENEEEIHNLIMRRGLTLENSENNNHIQNLWLIDDKYGYFSESSKGFSSKKGEKKSDIYLWTDDPQKPAEIIIIELKSTIKAHNPEKMVIQVKEYAQSFYKEPRKILNWDVNTKNCLYTGI